MAEILEELDAFLGDGFISDVVGKIKEGKEAEVYLCTAGERTGQRYLAAKVHREVAHRRFRDDGIYREGRVVASRTVAKALEKRSRFGQEMMRATWLGYEHQALRDMEAAGVRVPHVWAHAEHALLLTFLGSADGEAAPPLYTLRPERTQAWALWRDLERSITRALAGSTVHGDLSPYNVLVVGQDPYIIDWPQAVDARRNPNARWLLERDLENILHYFQRFGVTIDARRAASHLWQRWERGDLEVGDV